MNIPIQHIIGTAALISLVISASLVYYIFTSAAETDIKKQQLSQITENTALNLAEMINLVTFANYTYEPMIRIMHLPVDLSGSTYTIELVNETSQGKGYLIRANLTSNQHITASSFLPSNSVENLRIYTDSTTRQMTAGIQGTTIICSNVVYGKSGIVVWGRAQMETDEDGGNPVRFIEVGLGWLA